jgi:hypothetical protein
MIRGSRLEILKKAGELVDIDLNSDKPGFSLETWSYLEVLHKMNIKEMGSDYQKYHGFNGLMRK